MVVKTKQKQVVWFEEVGAKDGGEVGGKNANLGEMISTLKNKGIPVPDGFATTAGAYRAFIEANHLSEKIEDELNAYRSGSKKLHEAGSAIRKMFETARFPEDLAKSIKESYRELSKRYKTDQVSVAVRSSGTAEDLPEASFAGQQETYLNVTGEDAVLDACKKCFASLFTDRSINYRQDKGFTHDKIALSVGIQKMVRSDEASAGVIFTIDPDTGFRQVVVVTGSWGLGESVVQGEVTPDEFIVFKPLLNTSRQPIIGRTLGAKEQKIILADGQRTTKTVDTNREEKNSFCLTDKEVAQLARWAEIIEKHYGHPMDIEWAKDGKLDRLFIVQARRETVQSRKKATALKSYSLKEKGHMLLKGLAIGQAIATGKVQVIKNASEIDRFKEGSILVTVMTDPDWEPIMTRAAGIITDHGGRTSHAAIVSRELGIPAIVGTGEGTATLNDGQMVTLSCAEGDEGHVYEGKLGFKSESIDLGKVPETHTKVLMNISSPAGAFRWWQLPVKGIGLARLEFIIGSVIKIHPMALVHFDELKNEDAKRQIEEITRGYDDKSRYFVDMLSQGVAQIAASRYPDPVIVRTSDFKTNEYAGLIGGGEFEPEEANPMLGFRGASRYYSDRYREGFALECRALKKVREEMGLSNVIIMIPFCRTPQEAGKVLDVLEENGLKRGANGLEIYVMAEVPTNIILAEEFAKYFDGFSIGSNDLTQLTLGVDRDSSDLAFLFDEQNEAVKASISGLIKKAHQAGRKVGLCGQAPSDHPEFAEFLVQAGIDTISVNPDSVLEVIKKVSRAEKKS